MGKELTGFAAPGTYEVIYELLRDKHGRVLDAPTGTGFLAARLAKMGFEVSCSDIDEKSFKAKDLEWKWADLNAKLPYPDSYFDYLVCVEGIEHVENPAHTIREFHRVLKKGGRLIITTPNLFNLTSRIHYLLYGWFGGFAPYGKDVNKLFAHVNTMSFLELKFILEQCNFKIEKIMTNRMKYLNLLKIVNYILTCTCKLHYKLKPKLPLCELLIESHQLYKRMAPPDPLLYGEIPILDIIKVV